MRVVTQRFEIFRGDTVDKYFTVYEDCDETVRKQLVDAWITIKKRMDDSDSEAVIKKSGLVKDPQAGLIKVTLTSTETSVFPNWYYDYVYDIKIKDTNNKILTAFVGTMGVNPSITNQPE